MNPNRRNFFFFFFAGLSAIGLTSLLPTDGEAGEQREAKPLTTSDLVSSLTNLMKKAEKAGMLFEFEVLRGATLEILRGGKPPKVVICDTDTDCERKNPRLARQGGRK